MQSRSNSPKEIIDALTRTRTSLDELNSIASGATTEARALIRGLAEVVFEADKLSHMLASVLRSVQLLNEGLAPHELYRHLAECSREIRTSLALTESNWSVPEEGARSIRTVLRMLRFCEAVAEKLENQALPGIVRRGIVERARRVETNHRVEVPSAASQIEIFNEAYQHLQIMQTAFEFGERSRSAVSTEQLIAIVHPQLTHGVKLDPGTILPEFDRAPLQAFKAALIATSEDAVRKHLQQLIDHARREESLHVSPTVQALQYLVLEACCPDAVLRALADVKHASVLDFAEAVLRYPRNFNCHALVGGSRSDLDGRLRTQAFLLLLHNGEEDRLLAIGDQFAKSQHRSHGEGVLRLLLNDGMFVDLYPHFRPENRERFLNQLLPEGRARYMRSLLHEVTVRSGTLPEPVVAYIGDMAAAMLPYVAQPIPAPRLFQRSRIMAHLFGEHLCIDSPSDELCRDALQCLLHVGTSTHIPSIRTCMVERKLKRCINLQYVGDAGVRNPSLYALACNVELSILARSRSVSVGGSPTSRGR